MGMAAEKNSQSRKAPGQSRDWEYKSVSGSLSTLFLPVSQASIRKDTEDYTVHKSNTIIIYLLSPVTVRGAWDKYHDLDLDLSSLHLEKTSSLLHSIWQSASES